MSIRPHPTPDPVTGQYDPRDFAFPDPAPLGVTIFLCILVGLTYIVEAFNLYRIIHFRNHRLIQPRGVATLVPLQVLTVGNMTVLAISIIMGKPAFCWALDALNLASPVVGMHFNFNIPMLVYESELNSMKVERAHNGKETTAVKFLRVFTPAYRFLYMFFTSLFVVGVYLLLLFFAHVPGDCNRLSQLTVFILVVLITVVLFYFLIKLSKVQDPFYMKFENNLGSVGNLAPLFMMITYPIVPEMYGDWFDYRWALIFCGVSNIYINGLFASLLTFPSFVNRMEKLKGNLIPEDQMQETDTLGNIFALSQGLDLFQAVLANNVMLDGFTKFTVQEWSVENVLFYKGVEEYRDLWNQDPKQAKEFATMLINEYVNFGAPLEVNIEHTIRKSIIRQVAEDTLAQTTFDQAQKSVYDLMKKDSFEKWRKTPNFKETIQRLVNLRKTQLSSSKGSQQEGSKGSQSQHTELRMKVVSSTTANEERFV